MVFQEQQILQFMEKRAYKPMTAEELKETFQLDNQEEEAEFLRLLEQMEEEGKIVRTRAERYGVPERFNLVLGTLQGNAKGFAFVIPDREEEQDVYIHANDLNGAMDGDRVLARIQRGRKGDQRREGVIVRILKRGRLEIVGTYRASKHFGFVIPDDKRLPADIFIPNEGRGDAKDGQKVVVAISQYPGEYRSAEGVIKEVLGYKDDPGVDIVSIIRKHQLPEKFPPDVLAEAEAIPDEVQEEELIGRRDLRQRPMVTIDGEDAKDLDDAVSIETLPNGNIRLGVHIADVSYYVKEGSALDQEAYERGCSVYLVDRVIPMLPPHLSNGICSLHPQVDRLTLTCDMEFDDEGKMVGYDIYPSVIRTDERMTYRDVKKILVDEDPELIQRYERFVDQFRLMAQLANKLRERRMQRGAIDFNLAEAKIIVDENGKPTTIEKRERSISEGLIEEFMLAANETVAKHFTKAEVPFLYRIHEPPNEEKLQAFFSFITHFGYRIRGKADQIQPRALQQLLERVKGKQEETVISTVLLRSMQQAKYAAECVGHFGLATTFYSHFTAPIRRYPDLMIHRIINQVIREGKLSPQRVEELNALLPEVAKQSSGRERVAIEAERETDALKKAEYMLDKIGETFEGIISGVTSFGFFVELDNTVEGLVHISYMIDDYYHYDENTYSLRGEWTGKVFRIGDKVTVRVRSVDMEEYKVDFELVDTKGNAIDKQIDGTRRRKKKRRKKAADSLELEKTIRTPKASKAMAGDKKKKKKKRKDTRKRRKR